MQYEWKGRLAPSLLRIRPRGLVTLPLFAFKYPWGSGGKAPGWSTRRSRAETYSAATFVRLPSMGFRYRPVWLSGTSATSSGVPVATTMPPPSPPSGPMSIR
jgi:hypothetical protein